MSTKAPYGTARSRAVNFGDKTLVRADQRMPLAEVSVPEAQPFTCYVTARVTPPSAAAFPVVLLEWGHGGASIAAREQRVYRRLRMPVVASTVRMTGYLVGPDGKPLPSTSKVEGRFVAFVAPGADGETLRNTRWTSQTGATGQISDGPEQLVTVEGYSATTTPGWLMLFDALGKPADGTFPAMATPVAAPFRLNRFDTQGFRYGIAWAASSTPMRLTFDAAAELRVDVEMLS